MARKSEDVLQTIGLTCGLVMPISQIDGCTAEHWLEVKNIISDAISTIEDLGFTTKLVSEQDDVGVIQKRIVQNVYDSDVVVCDVSCKNANVMFELGMRLAFDKPTILIKDDQTDFSFDTGVIEHLVYPRDLRFSRIVNFKKALADKVAATYRAANSDPSYSTFLKHFGSFKVATLDQAIYTPDQAILTMVQELSQDVGLINKRLSSMYLPSAHSSVPQLFAFRIAILAGSDKLDDLLMFVKKEYRSVSVRDVASNEKGLERVLEITSPKSINTNHIIDHAAHLGMSVMLVANG